MVKEQAFFKLLELHNITLTAEEINSLKKNHGRGGKVNYNDALHSINVDLDVAVFNEEKWTVPQQPQPQAAVAGAALTSTKAVSQLSRLSLREFNNERAAELNTIDLGDYGSIPAAINKNGATSTVSKPV